MKRIWEAACISGKGRIREKNEDNFFFAGRIREKESETLETTFLQQGEKIQGNLFAVFDGLGGEESGEIASRIAADSLVRETNAFKKTDTAGSSPEVFLENAILHMNYAVCEMAKSRFRGMGTTAVLVCFYRGMVYFCNVGDSRAYYMHGNRLVKLSEDHTDARFMAERKILSRKPRLMQYIGIDPEEMMIEPYLIKTGQCEEDQYLLCSDGLTDMLSEKEIEDILREKIPAVQCVSRLMEAALARGGKDNITAILIQTGQV